MIRLASAGLALILVLAGLPARAVVPADGDLMVDSNLVLDPGDGLFDYGVAVVGAGAILRYAPGGPSFIDWTVAGDVTIAGVLELGAYGFRVSTPGTITITGSIGGASLSLFSGAGSRLDGGSLRVTAGGSISLDGGTPRPGAPVVGGGGLTLLPGGDLVLAGGGGAQAPVPEPAPWLAFLAAFPALLGVALRRGVTRAA